jgi:hypothetical protein
MIGDPPRALSASGAWDAKDTVGAAARATTIAGQTVFGIVMNEVIYANNKFIYLQKEERGGVVDKFCLCKLQGSSH